MCRNVESVTPTTRVSECSSGIIIIMVIIIIIHSARRHENVGHKNSYQKATSASTKAFAAPAKFLSNLPNSSSPISVSPTILREAKRVTYDPFNKTVKTSIQSSQHPQLLQKLAHPLLKISTTFDIVSLCLPQLLQLQ